MQSNSCYEMLCEQVTWGSILSVLPRVLEVSLRDDEIPEALNTHPTLELFEKLVKAGKSRGGLAAPIGLGGPHASLPQVRIVLVCARMCE